MNVRRGSIHADFTRRRGSPGSRQSPCLVALRSAVRPWCDPACRLGRLTEPLRLERTGAVSAGVLMSGLMLVESASSGRSVDREAEAGGSRKQEERGELDSCRDRAQLACALTGTDDGAADRRAERDAGVESTRVHLEKKAGRRLRLNCERRPQSVPAGRQRASRRRPRRTLLSASARSRPSTTRHRIWMERTECRI
jgi:hypothetical protein